MNYDRDICIGETHGKPWATLAIECLGGNYFMSSWPCCSTEYKMSAR